MLTHALVLTSPPAIPSLSDFAVRSAVAAIPETALRNQRWLSPSEAFEAEFQMETAEEAADIALRIRAHLNGLTLDVNVVPGDLEQRRKMLLVADMDSTIIQQECIDEMADVAGIKPQVAAITERAMRGEIDFEGALTERVSLLKGLTVTDLENVMSTRIQIMPGAQTLVATMKRHGAFAALVSGGFTYFTHQVAALAGFNADHANTLGLEGDQLTGLVVSPILGRDAKLEALVRYRDELGLTGEATLAVGDGANDLGMIEAAGLGVAYRAKPIVAAAAGAAITHGDLTALLYLQGYARDDFVAA